MTRCQPRKSLKLIISFINLLCGGPFVVDGSSSVMLLMMGCCSPTVTSCGLHADIYALCRLAIRSGLRLNPDELFVSLIVRSKLPKEDGDGDEE